MSNNNFIKERKIYMDISRI